MKLHGGGRTAGVTGRQEIEQGAPEHREQKGPLGQAGAGVPDRGWLCGGEQSEPVLDRLVGETGPGTVRIGQRAGVRLSPELEQGAVRLAGDPGPGGAGDGGQIAVRGGIGVSRAGAVNEGEFLGAGAGAGAGEQGAGAGPGQCSALARGKASRNCGSCWSIQRRAVTGWAGDWLTNASRSRARPATRG